LGVTVTDAPATAAGDKDIVDTLEKKAAREVLATAVSSVAPAVTAAVGTRARGAGFWPAKAASAEMTVMTKTAVGRRQQMEDEEEQQHCAAFAVTDGTDSPAGADGKKERPFPRAAAGRGVQQRTVEEDGSKEAKKEEMRDKETEKKRAVGWSKEVAGSTREMEEEERAWRKAERRSQRKQVKAHRTARKKQQRLAGEAVREKRRRGRGSETAAATTASERQGNGDAQGHGGEQGTDINALERTGEADMYYVNGSTTEWGEEDEAEEKRVEKEDRERAKAGLQLLRKLRSAALAGAAGTDSPVTRTATWVCEETGTETVFTVEEINRMTDLTVEEIDSLIQDLEDVVNEESESEEDH
jgi:hypothetical protein